MGFGTFVHHIGTLLLLVATVLLIVVDVTAPVVDYLAIMRVDLGPRVQGSSVTFGSFGYCHRGLRGDTDECSRRHIGYNPAGVMHDIDGTDFSSAAENTSKGLTRVMILHPVATGLCFVAFLLCLGSGIIGSVLASVFSLLAFIVTVVAMACDFVAFGIIKHDVNGYGRSRAHWASGIWCVLAAAIFTLVATLVILLTCCAGRAKKRREAAHGQKESSTLDPSARQPFWKRPPFKRAS
ncbi:hypothetical protein L249_5031 [Ophiocordyceps polyrhachis-furcata BCC 54312]|uniref:Pali-domain-containing protein n=1 Tax=Ophiocordyceps polyrhachis-furcata BCC 54312 TaxID=1330021 RepID=A0A367L3H3_9HYPO|nr:hypothetical protein L249_5031 [Ophiocordyceps polyrhachis-furcata BCC 54312]